MSHGLKLLCWFEKSGFVVKCFKMHQFCILLHFKIYCLSKSCRDFEIKRKHNNASETSFEDIVEKGNFIVHVFKWQLNERDHATATFLNMALQKCFMRPITSFRHSVARCVKNFLTHQRGIGTVAKKSSIGASQRGWHSNLTKIHWFIVFHILIWGGGLGALFGG